MDIEELAANMNATGNFLDIAAPDKSRATQMAPEQCDLLDSGGVVKKSDSAADPIDACVDSANTSRAGNRLARNRQAYAPGRPCDWR